MKKFDEEISFDEGGQWGEKEWRIVFHADCDELDYKACVHCYPSKHGDSFVCPAIIYTWNDRGRDNDSIPRSNGICLLCVIEAYHKIDHEMLDPIDWDTECSMDSVKKRMDKFIKIE